jgi:hypothetical protein
VTLVIAALGLAHAGVVPSIPQQYVAQAPAPTYIAAPQLPAGYAQQVRALPPIYRTAAPVAVAQQAPQQVNSIPKYNSKVLVSQC